MHGKAAYCHVLSGVVSQIKVSRYRFRCIFVISFEVSRCSRKQSHNLLPVSPMYFFLYNVHFMHLITLAEVQVRRSVILINYLDPVTLSVL